MTQDEDRFLTKKEAVALLFAWREANSPKYNLDYRFGYSRYITSGVEHSFIEELLSTLIERIRNSNQDPITEVASYYYEMDEVLATSDDDHFITHNFASFMENKAHDIMNYLRKCEKEINEYERKRMACPPWERH